MSHFKSRVEVQPLSTASKVIDAGTGMTQDFTPLKSICAFLNAWHVYADDPKRHVQAFHYCCHVNEDVRQCLIYDSCESNARLIGVEYMVSAKMFETFPPEEKRYWHSHVYEVKSGMLILPKPAPIPEIAWDKTETTAMEEIITIYGKTFHFWQVDRGDKIPFGEPKLMMTFTNDNQLDFEKVVRPRDLKFDTDYKKKKELRKDIKEPEIDEHVDGWCCGKGIRFKTEEVGI